MGNRVKLVLEVDMGDVIDFEGYRISYQPEDWEELFYQSDLMANDMEIVGVKVVEE